MIARWGIGVAPALGGVATCRRLGASGGAVPAESPEGGVEWQGSRLP